MIELNDGINIQKSKNSVGDLFEKWFGKTKDNKSKPDIEEAGIELKATPFKKLKNGQYSSKERLVLNIINYNEIVNETFQDSHFIYKNGKMEIAFYENTKNIPKDFWTIREVVYYEMEKNPKDFAIIKNDWEKISQYVKEGKAHELSESLTNYLAPCTKGASSQTTRSQPFSTIPAKQRAYSLKSSYMTSLLRKYVLGEEADESIIKDRIELQTKSIEDVVYGMFEIYEGWSIEKLKKQFGLTGESYQTNYQIAACILGLSGTYSKAESFEKIEEFEKASIQIKSVFFNEKNQNKENMSFPTFDFIELSKESWVNNQGEPSATWHNFLLETRFLFFVVKEVNGEPVFKGIKFFSVPHEDLQGPIREVWEDTVDKLNRGVVLEAVKWGEDIRINNNFISKSDDMICHIRPHESRRDYSIGGKYASKLPAKVHWINQPKDERLYSDQWMTRQCFWFNNTYIKKQVLELL